MGWIYISEINNTIHTDSLVSTTSSSSAGSWAKDLSHHFPLENLSTGVAGKWTFRALWNAKHKLEPSPSKQTVDKDILPKVELGLFQSDPSFLAPVTVLHCETVA